ncbi:SDR family oxidoreductase [Streptomyces alfalfae]|uniref:type I polyketide synthase n=1 Tax=Streptomyces alfalfae TaxID=1642299 RepID=UPI001BA817A2|nr:type I polyketide synthase [Streptomyces alfalfae]QUI33663.1 SDR family oxidoreductase [Streptomyces alfalfae]
MPHEESEKNQVSGRAPEPIAIVGVGLRFPGGSNSLDEFDTFLREGRSGIGPIPGDRWDVDAFTPQSPDDKGKIHTTSGGFLDRIDRFDASFFNISPKEAQYMDPQQRMLLETAWQALEHANIDPAPLRRGNGGVYIGASSIDYALELDSLPYEELDGLLASGITMFPLSGRLSYFLGWRGPSMSIDTACSSSLAALHVAVQGLRSGETDIALCGGVNALHHPRIPVMFSNAQMLSPDGRCKTFDESADGYARAEGCGIVVLKRLSDATRDGDTVLALVRGTAVGQDGDSAGLTVPNGPAQEKVIRSALAAAALAPEDIQYVEAHGTGTPLGDPIEFGAIGDTFADSHTKSDPLLVGSVKTNLGHMEPASGIVGVIKAVLQIRSATIYPHLNLDTPSGRIPWDLYPVRVPTACEPWKAPVRRAVVNSFGFAGTIGAVVLEQPPAPTADRETAELEAPATPMFTLSAKTAAALREQVDRYRQLLADDPALPVDGLCHTANVARTHHPYRLAGPVTDRAALTKLLDKAADRDHEGPSGIRKVAFMFSGQGAQYAGMGAALYERFPVFRRHVDACDRLFSAHLDRSVRDLVIGTADDPGAIDRTEYTQPALFTLEYSLAQLWMSWGVRPNVLIGHSIGEASAAAVAGLFSLADAVTLVAARARLMQAVRAEGGMAAVAAPAEDVLPLLEAHPDLALAAANAPDQCVISGASDALAEVTAELAGRGLRVDRLAVSHAFHSPLMAEVYDDFRAALDAITFREPAISLISNVTGKLARFREIGTADYWVRHIGEPVQFLSGIRAVARRGRHALVEIGPSTALTALAQRSLPVEDHLWLASLRRRDRGGDTTLRALAEYYAAGLPVSWTGYHEGRAVPAKLALPTYAFQRKRYWLPSVTPRRGAAQGGAAHHPLLGAETRLPQGGRIREFTAEFTVEELGALADFAAGDRTTLPAGAYVDLLLALQDAVHGHTRAAVRDVRLREPLTLTAETPLTLTTRLTARADGDAEVTVVTTAEAEEGREAEERVHVTAVLAAAVDQDEPGLTALALEAPVLESDAEDLYTDLASVGRPHGPRARVLVGAARHQDGVASGELECRGTTAVQQVPAELVEAALQAAVALDPEGPVFHAREIASVRHFKKPRGERLRAVARVRTEQDRRLADILLTEDGRPVLELGGVTHARPEGPAGQRQFLHRPEWVRRALPALDDTTPRHALLLGATADAGAGTARVTPVADLAALKAALDDTSVTDVCWVWRPEAGAMSAELMRAECERNYRELLGLVTVLDAAAQQRPPRLWLVTEGAQRLPGDRPGDGSHLAAATLWGFGRVLLTESPQYRTTLVDVEPGSGLTALFDECRAEAPGEYQVAHRAGGRYVRRLLPGDATRTWPGGFALHTPGSGDLSDLFLAPVEDRAPAAGEVQVRVASVALTAADARTALEGEESGGNGPVLGSLAAGTVLAAGAEAAFTAGDEVHVRHDGALRATLTVPASAVTLAPGTAAGGERDGATAFRLDEIGEALRTAAADTGAEVWVDVPGGPETEPAPARVRPDRTYLVTGGLGGLGLVTARKLVALGARHLTLVSRGGKATEEAAQVLAELSERAEVAIVRADVSDARDVRRLAGELAAGPHPVGGVVHAAGSFDKRLIAELTWEALDAQLAPKAYGGWLLHEAAEASFPDLEFFVTYSSIASVLGGATQGHYAAASAGLDSLAEWRGLKGLPGLSVNWGAWARVGMSARLDEQLAAEIDRSGVRFFSPTRALDTLARLWQRPGSRRVVGEFDWARYVSGGGVDDAFYDRLARQDQAGADGAGVDLAALVALPKPERTALIAARVREQVAGALHMDDGDDLDQNAEFVSLGLDSLMAQTVKGGLETLFRLPLPASLTFDHPTVRRLTEFLDGRLAPAAQQHP